MPGKSGQRTHDRNGPFNAHGVEVFLPYEAVVDRLEGAAKQLAGASVLHRGGLAILRLGAGSTSDGNDSRPDVWLQGGIHANEWIGPAVVLRLMDELVRNSELRGRATWYLLPVVDAHGYKRTWAGERFLRTTENRENPNLNFPFRWGEAPPLLRLLLGRRLRKWMGPHPASAGCVTSLIAELRSLNNLELFMDFYGFGRLWLYPWCYSSSPSPHDTEHKQLARLPWQQPTGSREALDTELRPLHIRRSRWVGAISTLCMARSAALIATQSNCRRPTHEGAC